MLTSQDYNVGQAELLKRYYNRRVHLHGECFYGGLEWFVWEDNRKLMTPLHAECLNYAIEHEYVQVRYAQGDWQTRDPELILYLEVPGKPPLVGVGLTERAVGCLRELRQLDRDTRDVTSTISRAGDMMRVAASRDDIPCSAFLPAGDAPELQAYLGWTAAVSYPEVLKALVDFPGGLLPMRNVGSSQMILIAKTMREIAVTAQMRKFLRIYLVPLRAGDVHTCGVLTAFFDDHDEPLTISTPLFDEEIAHEIFQVLSSDSFDIHFFDEYNRKLIGFRAENPDATRFRSFAKTIQFVPGTLELARQFHDDMGFWFGARSTANDNAALRINLLETLLPDNLDPESQTPGDFNEPDIEMGLHRAFSGEHVYRNPVRATEGREFVDVLVATAKTVLLIQAKASPITAEALSRTIDRKKATTAGHVKRAAAQLKGSINHLRSGSSIEIITGGQRCDVSMSGREVFGLVIVKELFDPERPACSRLVLSVSEETGIPCLLLDYLEFQHLTFFRRTEESFVGTLREIFSAAREHGLFPRSRFGLVADGPTVHSPPYPRAADS